MDAFCVLNCLCPTIGGSGFKLFRQSECVKQRAFSLEAEERWWCRSIPHIRDYLKGLGFLTNATPGEPQFLHNCPFSANRWSGNIWSDKHIYIVAETIPSSVIRWNAKLELLSLEFCCHLPCNRCISHNLAKLSDYLVFVLFSKHFGTTFWVEWVSCRIPSV